MAERPPRPDDDAWRSRRRDEAHRRTVRRRRVVALAALAALVVVVVVAVSQLGGGTSSHAQAAARGGTGTNATATTKGPPPLTPHQRELIREDTAVTKLLKRTWFITRGGTKKKEIALTFDDGPGPYTRQVLDVLHRKHAAATFFEVGFMVHYFSDALKEQVKLGYPVGDHTEDHKDLATLPRSGQRDEIVTQTQWLAKYHAPKPNLFRAPYGSWNATTRALLRKLHMLAVFWTVDTDDWEQPGTQNIIDSAVNGAEPGAIILLHDAGGTRTQTIAALPTIIDRLRARGYKLVTVPRLIADSPPRGRQRQPIGLEGG